MGKKKRVTFADLLGFSLVSVVEIDARKEDPEKRLYRCLRKQRGNTASKTRYLTCLFEQPEKRDDFLDRVRQEYVCLESVVCDHFIVRGFVRVLNVSYSKVITIRYTTDEWKTIRELEANHLCTSNDGTTDTFFFCVQFGSPCHEKCKMEFALCYAVDGREYWDNNHRKNYLICCSSEE